MLSRVQVKTIWKRPDRQVFTVSTNSGRKNKKIYTKEVVDYISIYLLEFDVFYIIPVEAVTTLTITIDHFNPDRNNFLQYQERWDLLKTEPKILNLLHEHP